MIDWELQIKHSVTDEYVTVPFSNFNLDEKSGVDVSGLTIVMGDKAGYRFSWIKDCSELKIFKNGMEHFHGYITAVSGGMDSKGETIRIAAKNYWHYILKRRLTTFERFGNIGNINPTELVKTAIGTKTIISDADWEADKINTIKFGSISTDLAGDVKIALTQRNDTYYGLMTYLRSVRWRVDEPEWQGSSEMKTVYTTVSESRGGGSSNFWFSRDDGETWYLLTKSAATGLSGSETTKNKGKYKIELWGNEAEEDNNVYLGGVDSPINIYDGNPNTQQIVRTADGTLHTCVVRDASPKEIGHHISRDNGKNWEQYEANVPPTSGAYDVADFAIAATPNGDIGILFSDTNGAVRYAVRPVTKDKGAWEWTHNATHYHSIAFSGSDGLSIFGVRYHNGTAWKQGFARVLMNTDGSVRFSFYNISTGIPSESWVSTIRSTGADGDAVIWCHKNWGEGASSKRVLFVAHSDTTNGCQIKYARYTSGGSPIWNPSWTTIDAGAAHSVDMISDRVKHDYEDEDYNIYVWYLIGTTLYCKYSALDDLTTWTALSGSSISSISTDYWDVSQLIDKNFIVTYTTTGGNNRAVIYKNATGYGTYLALNTYAGDTFKIAQESTHGYGDILACHANGTEALQSYLYYSSDASNITAMTLNITTDSETGILEGNMDSYTNTGLDSENVDYTMNRETRLTMLQNIQKMMPVAAGSSSPYPFWDIEIRVEDGIAYMDVAEELGDTKSVTITHEDEQEGDLLIKILDKNIDRGEIINALTLVGGGWSAGGVEVIPTKNVATDGVQAGTELQLAGTVINKRQSTDLTIENIAYGILNVTSSPRITITLSVKGDARNLFTLNDKITVISERANINQTLKVRGMHWSVSDSTTLKLTLDNGARTLDKYMVEIVNNLNTMGFNSQGDLTRPPIFLNKNFSKDEPATLNFYVPSNKKTVKALLYVKTQKYTSYEASVINEFGYYPSDVRLFVDELFHEGFGGRGNESTAVEIAGMDITPSLDLNGDGLVDAGSHTLKFTSAASTNNSNGIGRIEAYLVLLESET